MATSMIESINTVYISENLQKVARSVSFQSSAIIRVSPSKILDDDRTELWYQQEELVRFKDDVMNLCRKLRGEYAIENQPLLDTNMDLVLQAKNCCARGLENLVSTERQRNRFLATKTIVEAQERYENPEQLAIIASKCSAWAKEVALCTGCQDFYQVYNPEMLHLVPQTMSAQFPVRTRKGRSNSNESESSIRRKTASKKRQTMSAQFPVRTRKGRSSSNESESSIRKETSSKRRRYTLRGKICHGTHLLC